jgi:hypothetical protein
MTKKVIGEQASTQADAVAAIKAAAEQRQQSLPQQDNKHSHKVLHLILPSATCILVCHVMVEMSANPQ